MIAESRLHFALYDNAEEGFHERQNPGSVSDQFSLSVDPASVATARFAAGKATFSSECRPVDFVDYEVNHLRTTGTGSVAENGKSLEASVDLLLRDRAGQYPIVCEVKAATDRNPFLALIQGLTYTVELSTDAQQRRLEAAYPGTFNLAPGSPALGIAIMSLGIQTGTNAAEFSELAKKLADAVVRKTDYWLRGITFYDAALTAEGVSVSAPFHAEKSE